MSAKRTLTQRPPSIALSREDYAALDRLVGDRPGTGPAGLLQDEMDRAKVFEAEDMPKGVVTLYRWLHFKDGTDAEVRRIKLVMPQEADIDAGLVSILSYVGTGLIGLYEGDSIDWPAPSGEPRRLSVIMVEDLDPLELVQA